MTEIGNLVLKARGGDQQAMTLLYEQCHRRAYYLALQILKDEDEAQDILQDSFIKAFVNLNRLQDPDKFQPWLGQIVTNKCKDYLKKKRPKLFTELDRGEDGRNPEEFEDESWQFSPDMTVDYKETKRLIQEMIDELPEEQRIAIVLRYMEDIPVKQIAEIMECSEGTVKSRLNYGRRAIKEKVLALEKKGTKLYCMPLVPFLFWMYRQEAMEVLIPAAGKGAGISAGALRAETGTGAGAEASFAGTGAGAGQRALAAEKSVEMAAVKGTGKTGTAALGKAAGMKAAAVGAAIVLSVGAAAGGWYLHTHKEDETIGKMISRKISEAGETISQKPYKTAEDTEAAGMETEKAEWEAEKTRKEAEKAEQETGQNRNLELLKIMSEYGNQLNCNIDASTLRDKGDYYEIQAMIVVPLTFEKDPMEGKREGDPVPIEVSRLWGRVSEFTANDPAYEEDIGDMICYQDGETGTWSFVGPNDAVLATEVYNGTITLLKEAQIKVFDYDSLTYTDQGWEGYEYIRPEKMMENSQDWERWGMMGELEVPRDEMVDGVSYNPATGKLESTGPQLHPGYVMVPSSYQITLNEDGEITDMERSWHP